MSLPAASRLGPYEILAPLGAGGMGEIYRALDSRLGREVAIKVLPATLVGDPERRQRFAREARAAATVNHPNLLTIFDVGTEGETPYLVTELLDGETMAERLSRGRPSPEESLSIAAAIARGLGEAHARGIVHRDLKPANVFLTRDGRVKILDFGLAQIARPDSAAGFAEAATALETQAGTLLGTPAYMAPEQARGEPVDARADLFAWGVIFYELLSGRNPFLRSTQGATLSAILAEPAPPLAAGIAKHSSFDRLFARALAKRPADRIASAAEILSELERVNPPGAPVSGVDRAAAPSVAVLPFADMSPERDQEYLCEGIAEEIINALARVAGLRVAARTAAFQFRGAGGDVQAIGERLGVASLLEGSVRKAGDRLRVTVQLVACANGYQLWSGRFDGVLADIFAVQDEIAEKVLEALRGVLTEQDRRALKRGGTSNVEAYELYLRGRQQVNTRMIGIQRARELFKRAIGLDATYAQAWAGLADVDSMLLNWYGANPEVLGEAEEASRRALELAPDSAEAHTSRGNVRALGRDYEAAEREFEAAIALDPKLFDALYWFARAVFAQGKMARAAELFERAAQARPEDYQSLILCAMPYESMRQPERVRDAMRRGLARAEAQLALNPGDVRALYLGAGALAQLGERDKAFAWAERAFAADPDDHGTAMNVACVLTRLGKYDRALDLIERIVRSGFGQRDWIAHDTDLDPLRGLPRFQALFDEIGKSKYGG